MNPEEFQERLDVWKRLYEKDKLQGGGFTDPDLEAIMLESFNNPGKAAQVVIDRFDAIVEEKHVPYLPDEPDPAEALCIYVHLEAAQLFRLLKLQGYSEKTRESLEKALNAFTRCKRALNSFPEIPWPLEYSISLEAIASFLLITRFFILKSDGNYEDALNALLEGIQHIQESHSIYSNNIRLISTSGIHFYYTSFSNDLRKIAPWMKDLNHQLFVDSFESIRKGNRINDTKRLAEICESFIELSGEPWLSNKRPDNTLMSWLEDKEVSNDVMTEEFYWDHASDFWENALGWLEAQLTPSEFKEILNEREENAAEKRLKTYFFEGDLWDTLPERTRSSLISADRDWFSGTVARKEAIFNELRIAAEELLHSGLWNPLAQWVQNLKEHNNDTKWLIERRQELSQKGLMPTLLDFERTCRLSITNVFLKEKGVSNEDRAWFCNQLPKSLYHLRRARNRAEHESDDQWTRQDLSRFYNEFIGIGQPGILPKLYRMLRF